LGEVGELRAGFSRDFLKLPGYSRIIFKYFIKEIGEFSGSLKKLRKAHKSSEINWKISLENPSNPQQSPQSKNCTHQKKKKNSVCIVLTAKKRTLLFKKNYIKSSNKNYKK
jgi:hypothetical protein